MLGSSFSGGCSVLLWGFVCCMQLWFGCFIVELGYWGRELQWEFGELVWGDLWGSGRLDYNILELEVFVMVFYEMSNGYIIIF